MTKQNWLNNHTILHDNLELEKPCHSLEYCPYGQLVEEFPLHPKGREDDLKKIECKTFGHDCPVYYHAEGMTE